LLAKTKNMLKLGVRGAAVVAGCSRQMALRCYSTGIQKTCLHDFHVDQGGKMVDFAGYYLPIQYKDLGIAASHKHTRTHCSIFDVSHMLQTRVYGKDRIRFMEELCVADVHGLKNGQASLSLFTNDEGGIIDDLIVTKADDEHLYVVSNAGCRHKDIPLMQNKAAQMKGQGLDVSLEFGDDRGLIAVQGPEAAKVLQAVTNIDMTKLAFMNSVVCNVAGVENCRVTRCGYTGEDGVEISIPGDKTAEVTQALLESKDGSVRLAGLGARDSLRLEAGLCLYGNDIDETTTPVEAALVWTIGKRRRQQQDVNVFPGAAVILKQLKEKSAARKRVGLVSTGPPARGHSAVLDPETAGKVGEVTSGCPAPSMEKANTNVAMAYVPTKMAKAGTKVQVQVRNKTVDAVVTKMPFVPANYYSGGGSAQ